MLSNTMDSFVLLQEKIVAFLKTLPNLDDVRSRQAFIYSAGLDPQLKDQISFDLPVAQFIPLLVSLLFRYGTLSTGKHAIQAILEAAKGYIGNDKQEY